MKIPLLADLWTLDAEKSELEPGIESILDTKGENSFLRKAVLLLALVALAQTAALLIKARAPRSAAPEPGSDDVTYTQEVQHSSQTAISAESSSATIAPCLTAPKPSPAVSVAPPARQAQRDNKPPAAILAGQIVKSALEPPAAPQTKPGKAEASFWDLLNRVQNDPDREILDRTFSANGLAIHLEEICKAGIVHFELENTSERVAYLPRITAPGRKVRAYFERQVLEPDTSQQGLLVFDDPKPTGTVEAVISAANVPAFKVRIDVPDWRKR